MSDDAPDHTKPEAPPPPGPKAKRKDLARVVPPEDKERYMQTAMAASKLRRIGGLGVENKSDAEIKQWADRKANELLPQAIAEVAHNLKYGDAKQRDKAVEQVLDMHGMRRREAQAGNHPTIVLNFGGDKTSLKAQFPWLSRSDAASEGEGEEK